MQRRDASHGWITGATALYLMAIMGIVRLSTPTWLWKSGLMIVLAGMLAYIWVYLPRSRWYGAPAIVTIVILEVGRYRWGW